MELPSLVKAGGRTAVIFAHPAHEWFAMRALLDYQPDVYYLTRGAYTDPRFESAFRQMWTTAGFRGTMHFGSASEPEIFQRYLHHDHAWFTSRRDELADWLTQVDPELAFCDPFEWYNSAHDLVPLLLSSALAAQRRRLPQLWEYGLAVHTIPPSLQPATGWPTLRLSDEELEIKRWLLGEMKQLSTAWAQGVNHELSTLTAPWTEEQLRTERYRPMPAWDFSMAPPQPPWPTYDDRGKRRVAEGRSAEAICFESHFRPLAERLLTTPGRTLAA